MASNNTKTPNKTNANVANSAAGNNLNKLLKNMPTNNNNNAPATNAAKNGGNSSNSGNNNKMLQKYLNELNIKPTNNSAKIGRAHV